jgi:hypothetical protein
LALLDWQNPVSASISVASIDDFSHRLGFLRSGVNFSVDRFEPESDRQTLGLTVRDCVTAIAFIYEFYHRFGELYITLNSSVSTDN